MRKNMGSKAVLLSIAGMQWPSAVFTFLIPDRGKVCSGLPIPVFSSISHELWRILWYVCHSEKLEEWGDKNFMKFNEDKHEVLTAHRKKYSLATTRSSCAERTWGSWQRAIWAWASSILGFINWSMARRWRLPPSALHKLDCIYTLVQFWTSQCLKIVDKLESSADATMMSGGWGICSVKRGWGNCTSQPGENKALGWLKRRSPPRWYLQRV